MSGLPGMSGLHVAAGGPEERSGLPERSGGKIQRLEEAVVNRIAAGEVHRVC